MKILLCPLLLDSIEYESPHCTIWKNRILEHSIFNAMSSLAKTDYPPYLNQLTNYKKFTVKLNNIKNKFPHSTFEENRMLEHSIFQCNVFIGKNRLYGELTKILTCELMS